MSTTEESSQMNIENLVERLNEALRPLLADFVQHAAHTVQETDPRSDTLEEKKTAGGSSDIDCPELKEMRAMTEGIKELLEKIELFAYKDKINDELHKELQQYKNGMRESFLAPLLKAVVREYDRVGRQHHFYLEKSKAEPQSELFNKLLSEFDMLSISLLSLLSDYEIEPFGFDTGDSHDVRLQKILEVVETEDPEKDGSVAECVICGFRNIETARIFRQAQVRIYKLKK